MCDSCVRAHRSSPVPAAALCAAWPSRLLLRAEGSHALMRWSIQCAADHLGRGGTTLLAVCTGAPPRPCHRHAASLPRTASIGSVAPVGGRGRVCIHASATTGTRRPGVASGLASAGVRRVCVSAPGTQERPECRNTGAASTRANVPNLSWGLHVRFATVWPKSSSHRYANLCPYMPLCGNLRRAAALLEILAEVCGV